MIYFEVTIAIHHVYLVFYQHHYINFNTHRYLNLEKLGKHPNQNTATVATNQAFTSHVYSLHVLHGP